MPGDLPKTLVLDEDIEKCFGAKDDIAARENSIKTIHENISSENEAIEFLRTNTKSALESIALSVGTYKTDKEVIGKLETERTELATRKQSLETRLEDGGFDEENLEDMILLQSLKAEEEELNLSLSGVLTKIEECSTRLLHSQTEMKLSRSKHEELKVEQTELKVDNAQCESWGFEVAEKVKQEWERKTGLLNQRVAFRESIKGLYLKTPKLQSERRLHEGLKRQCLNITYTKVEVERTILASAATTKVRGISPCSTILSEREEDLRDFDVSLVDTSPMPRTRSKSRKRNVPRGDSVRKVRTMSHVTEAEMSTGIGTPCAHTKVVLKPLGEIETLEALKSMGDNSRL
ncbi:hypothetical protein R1sor_024550 [Riccia sorocarpa]|uniref:Uncharacterized protein n=1 Tax=Riccia sorocarpa TaxID=122646 RepID=A0ABD3GUU0_9MARC